MKCPKCGFEGSFDDECPACGVFVSKFISAQKKKTAEDNAFRDWQDGIDSTFSNSRKRYDDPESWEEKEDISADSRGDSDVLTKTLTYLSYGWIVLTNLITIGVIVAIYSAVSSTFEVIIVSLTIFIYLLVAGNSMAQGIVLVRVMEALNTEFIRIRKLLNENIDPYETEMVAENRKKRGEEEIKWYIGVFSHSIIYIITLWHLVNKLIS